jgi:hypothetical protein
VPSLGQRAEFLAADTFLLILSGLLLASMHRRPANAACRRLPWLVPVAIVSGFVGLVAEEGHVPDAWDWQLQRFLETSAAMLCLAHFSPGLFRAAFRALTGGWAMAMILVAIGCWAGRLLPPPPDERDYALRRGELLAAIGAFRRDTRALPTRLADLTTRVAPTTGCDAAGNPAALAGGWHGPYLRRLPIDPVTRRRDTWRYEPTGDLLVDAAWPTDYEPGPKYSVW